MRPGEYPNYLFKAPFPAPTAEESQEFREKCLFGDWLGERSELAKLGIKPSLFFILDPFGNVTGGQQRGFTQYNLAVLDVTLETASSSAGLAGSFTSATRAVRAPTSPRRMSATISRSSSRPRRPLPVRG